MHIREEELIHIIIQFTTKDMPNDLAMLFLTENCNFFQIFEMEHCSTVNFYKKVFDYIFAWVIDKIDNGKLDIAIRDVFTRIYCDNYTKELKIHTKINKNAFSLLLIEKTMEYIVENGRYKEAILLMDSLMINPDINRSIILPMVKNNSDLCHIMILENIINEEYLTTEELADLIIFRSKDVDDDTIRHLINTIFSNRLMMLDFARVIMSLYNISVTRKNDDTADIEIELINIQGETAESVERIRKVLSEIIYIDAELDFFDWLNESKIDAAKGDETTMVDIYLNYQNWMRSPDREKDNLSNMIFYGFEDTDYITGMNSDLHGVIYYDIRQKEYLFDMRNLDGYTLFLRAFNVNRFRLLQFNNGDFIKGRLKERMSEFGDLLMMALSDEFYIFIKYD